MRPFTENELSDCDVTFAGSTRAGRWAYEDTIFTSGIVLWALTEGFRVSGDKCLKQQADRLFDNLQPILKAFDAIEPGYIGKPWGGEPSRNTTIDQTLYLCMGLDAYNAIAGSARQQRIKQIIIQNTTWWVQHNYYNMIQPTDQPSVWVAPSHAGGMLAQVYLAYKYSEGDPQFRQAYEQLITQHAADQFPTRQSCQWEPVDEQGRMLRRIALWHHAYGLSLWSLSQHWPERLAYWQQRLVDQWHKELKLGLREDGNAYCTVRINLTTEMEEPLGLDEVDQYLNTSHKNNRPKAVGWSQHSAALSGTLAAHIGLSAIAVADVVPWMRRATHPTVHRVLHGLDMSDMMRAYDPDGRQLHTGLQHCTQTLTAKAIAPWLLTYWWSQRIGLL